MFCKRSGTAQDLPKLGSEPVRIGDYAVDVTKEINWLIFEAKEMFSDRLSPGVTSLRVEILRQSLDKIYEMTGKEINRMCSTHDN